MSLHIDKRKQQNAI